MDLKELELLGDSQDSHWYFVSKSRALLQAISDRPPGRILDVGAGSGFFSKMLLRDTTAKSAICVDPGYAEDRSETCAGKPIAFLRAFPAAPAAPVSPVSPVAPLARLAPLALVGDDHAADLVLLMDVLEHVDDDVALVREYAAPARPGTRFIVSVPAFSWLWSGHDVFLEHRRRYTLKGVLRVLSDSGLTPVGGFYFFASVFPAVGAQRLWSRRPFAAAIPKSQLRQHHRLTNLLLTRLCVAESAMARHNRLFGLTAFAVAEKTCLHT